MALTSIRNATSKSVAAAPGAKRTRMVRVSAMKEGSKPTAAFAAAAAAALLVSGPAMAVPELLTLNPVSEVAAGPGTKAKQAADKVSGTADKVGRTADKVTGQGALSPDVEGQIRAGSAGSPGAASNQRKTFVAANKDDQASAINKYPQSGVNWFRR